MRMVELSKEAARFFSLADDQMDLKEALHYTHLTHPACFADTELEEMRTKYETLLKSRLETIEREMKNILSSISEEEKRKWKKDFLAGVDELGHIDPFLAEQRNKKRNGRGLK